MANELADSLARLATFMQKQHELELQYGKPDRPMKTTIPGKPGIPGVPESRPASYTLPGIGPSYGVDNLISPEPRVMPGIGPVRPAVPAVPATPDQTLMTMGGGTPGIYELDIKKDLATQGLISPESLQDTFSTRGFGKTKFTSGKASDNVLYNPFNPDVVPLDQAGSIPADQRNQYVAMSQKDASIEIGKYVRQKLAGGAQAKTEMMRLYSELNDLKSRYIPLRQAQKDLLQALESELAGKSGVADAANVVGAARKRRESAYKAQRLEAQRLIQQNLTAPITKEERQSNLQGILQELTDQFGEEDFFDLDVPATRNKFM